MELVPEDKDAVLEYALCMNYDKLILIYLRDVKVRLQYFVSSFFFYHKNHCNYHYN